MADPFQDALNTLISLGADRVLVLQGPSPYQARLSYGFDSQRDWVEQISLGVLERPLQGELLCLDDVSKSPLGERFSVQVSGIRSVVCVPFWSPSSRILGLLYADTRSLQKAFGQATLRAVQECARRLERALYGVPLEPPAPEIRAIPPPPPLAETGVRLGLKRQSPPRLEVEPVVAPPRRPIPTRAEPRSQVVFFRSLATMMSAGLPLDRALSVLTRHQSDPALRQACSLILQEVVGGRSLSQAMATTQIFSAFDCSLIEVGERTGCLDRVVHQLAALKEKFLSARLRLQSALAYPLLVSALCLAGLLLAPPLVLRGQLDILRQCGQDLPVLTRGLMAISDLLISPPGVLTLVLLGCTGLWLARRYQTQLRSHLLQLPALRTLWIQSGCARLARGLGLAYRVGLPIHQALPLAGRLSALEAIEKDIPRCLEALNQGQSVAEVLSCIGSLPPTFLALVRAGEDAGKLDVTLEWVANFFESEFEGNLEAALALVQPLLMALMGLIVGLLLVATLQPMVTLVQQL